MLNHERDIFVRLGRCGHNLCRRPTDDSCLTGLASKAIPMNTSMKELDKRRHIVIVGGGFGGLYAAQALRKAPVKVTRR